MNDHKLTAPKWIAARDHLAELLADINRATESYDEQAETLLTTGLIDTAALAAVVEEAKG